VQLPKRETYEPKEQSYSEYMIMLRVLIEKNH